MFLFLCFAFIPLSSKRFAISSSPLPIAAINALSRVSGFNSLMFALFSKSFKSLSYCPFVAAVINGLSNTTAFLFILLNVLSPSTFGVSLISD